MQIDLKLLQNSTAAMIYRCNDDSTKKALKKHLCTIDLMIETSEKPALNIADVSGYSDAEIRKHAFKLETMGKREYNNDYPYNDKFVEGAKWIRDKLIKNDR